MQRTLIHILIIILLSSGVAAAADLSNDVMSFHGHSEPGQSQSEPMLLSTLEHNDTEHHAHHGCHISAHMVALASDTPSIEFAAASCTPSSLNPVVISRRSAPPTQPPRV